MSRLIVVSNRVSPGKGEATAGGLATALNAALSENAGLWFGWSGQYDDASLPASTIHRDEVAGLATIDLPESEFDGYYSGLANAALWPACHGRLDLVRIDHDAYASYQRVNARFADALRSIWASGDRIWVHDYHLIPLGHELRRRGVSGPIGFFLHIPFPPPEVFSALPWAMDLAAQLGAFDLIGFQTEDCARNFRGFVERSIPEATSGPDWVRINGRTARVGAFPIGIDTERFAALARSAPVEARVRKMRDCLKDRVGIVGVERLDYSKGIAERFQAMEALFERHPRFLERLTLVQIAAPSRFHIAEYQTMRADLEALSGRINSRFATLDWTPIHYLNRSFAHGQIAALFRACRVGLVTPLRDGMNLVAKEYVTAQDPDDPGVLILSRFAGAAHELRDALLVNPYDIKAMATAIATAVDMPLVERRERWRRSMHHLQTHDVHRWSRQFLASLSVAHTDRGAQAAA